MRVFVSAGTDHFTFDRLMGWIERWAESHPEDEVVVQHGSSRTPGGTTALRMLTVDEMDDQVRAADVVVVSGGPGAVMTAREGHRRPISVPRHKGEAVDDHQQAFARLMSEREMAFEADTEADLRALLERAREHPEEFRCEPPGSADLTVARFAAVADHVACGGRRP
jgi:UDP-N-acetylglucosamine transferase subunit ALG13